jgi:hypothetical protein
MMSLSRICPMAEFLLVNSQAKSNKRWLFFSLFILMGALSAAAVPAAVSTTEPLVEQAPKAPYFAPWDEPVLAKIGYTLVQATEEFGSPTEVFSLRGEQPWHDDVVFYYDTDHFYLFWWDNRVWQIRFDQRYTGQVVGVHMGEARAEIKKLLGNAFHETDQDLYYQLPDRGFPVRARLVFAKDKLSDIYLYRSDF